MDDYAGRVLADRYRLPLPPSEVFELVETRAFDTYSGQEVLIRQIPLPEVVEAEVEGEEAHGTGPAASAHKGAMHKGPAHKGSARQGPGDSAVRRALAAATAAAQIPDHPRLDQVFHVFAEGSSLWIISELVSARPLAALLAERSLSPHRAAEVAADVLTALRALHSHGWTHRNITTRTVLICDDGRAILTGLAAGAAEEALCGYDPVPEGVAPATGSGMGMGDGKVPGARPGVPGPGGAGALGRGAGASGGAARPAGGGPGPGAASGPAQGATQAGPSAYGASGGGSRRPGPGAAGRPQGGSAYRDQGAAGGFLPPGGTPRPRAPQDGSGPTQQPGAGAPARGPQDPRAARAGAIAAYRAGARAAAARAAAENAAHTPTGTSTWGGGSAASGTAPAAGRMPSPRPVPGAPGVFGPASPEGAAALPAPRAEGSAPAAAAGSPAAPPAGSAPGGWGGDGSAASAYAAERARQARMVVVGAVTERWSPEQAWPVQESWQLAPPVGPAADLWALGALLFRVVQGHAPYPEDSTADLLQLVCVEPPAYAEECGALRPVVESLMRKDPAERPEFEELRGWLRSLIRSAPEPDIGSRTVTVPSIGPGVPADQHRLPVIRRKGELVRRRRGRPVAAVDSAAAAHGRHKKTAKDQLQPRARAHTTGHLQEQRVSTRRGPLSLGRLLLGLILLVLIGVVLYAVLLMPGADKSEGKAPTEHTGTTGAPSAVPNAPATEGKAGQASVGSDEPSTEAEGLAKGFALRQDPKGFTVAVAKEWQRRGENDRGQVVYFGGDCQLVVVPGRDKVTEFGSDPMAYQQDKEPELDAYRSSSWSGASGLRRIDVGQRASAEGTFNWNDSSGRQVYVRNSAMILGGRYHVLQVIGPMNEQRLVDGYFDQATATYRTR
ncbi:protein kinase [Streptomyces blastmyceticus]|uniref:Protein kinase domain-containing protein n=1 Tax=Streptomyces blastmyceticus TaxID=68180 RepID=A0ABP3GB57_9ACTN